MIESVDAAALARLHAAAGFVFDLDGSLVLGDKHNRGIEALPRAADTLRLLDGRDVPWVLLTNGTVRVPVDIAAALHDAGLDVPPDRVLTPATVAAEYFVARGMRRIFVLGVEGAWRPLADAGLEILLPETGGCPTSALNETAPRSLKNASTLPAWFDMSLKCRRRKISESPSTPLSRMHAE